MIVNGSGQPKLVVIDAAHNIHDPVATILLPYCQKLTETFEPSYVKHRVQGKRLTDGKGWDYSAKLDYSGYLDGSVLHQMAPSFEIAQTATQTKKMLVLIPRIDVPERHYNVIFSKPFDMSLIIGEGHGDIVFEFEGIDTEPTVPMVLGGYGATYGGFNADLTPSAGYGNCL